MYILYSPVGYSIVVGVQGRYLLPVIFMLSIVFYGFAIVKKNVYLKVSKLAPSFLFFTSIITIVFRYYIT